jgi:hypothetical protein
MTEAVKPTNPYAVDEFATGGQGWDDQVVQVTKVEFKVSLMTQGKRGSAEEKPWIDPDTGKQGFNNVLAITGIPVEGDKEWTNEYGTGAFVPAEGGEQCVHPQDPSKRLHVKCKAAIFLKGLSEAGFDTATLYPKISALVGQRILFKGVPILNKDGSIKKNKAGFEQFDYYPIGIEEGGAAAVSTQPTAAAGNGLAELADETILNVLGETEGGKLTRAELVRAVSKALAGQAEANKIVALIVRQDYHTDKPWTYTGTEISL